MARRVTLIVEDDIQDKQVRRSTFRISCHANLMIVGQQLQNTFMSFAGTSLAESIEMIQTEKQRDASKLTQEYVR